MAEQPDLYALASTLTDLGADIASQNARIDKQNSLVAKQNEQLKKFVPRSRLWWTVAVLVLVIAGAVVAGFFVVRTVAGGRDEAIRRNSCALRGVLAQAQSAGTRNPIPPGLDPDLSRLVEESRKRAAEFYGSALADIDATLADLGGPPCAAPPTGAAAP